MGTVRRLKTRDMELQVWTIRSIRVNPEFPDSNPEVPVSPDSRNKTEFEQSFDLICDELTQVTN